VEECKRWSIVLFEGEQNWNDLNNSRNTTQQKYQIYYYTVNNHKTKKNSDSYAISEFWFSLFSFDLQFEGKKLFIQELTNLF
jgi:hypothetical protein